MAKTKILGGFTNNYELDENEIVSISYYETAGGYTYRVIHDVEKGKVKRISAQDYISALEYHYNY